jgi:ribosome assembly protein RRB1
VATFKWHIAPITSIEWHPSESSVLAVSGSDDQISLWDFAVERDQEQSSEGGDATLLAPNGMPIPPHLLFVHQGQKEVKEIHWHPQSPGVIMSTAASGFNIFKTISI